MHSYVIAKNILEAVLSEAEKLQGEHITSMVVELDGHDFSEAESVQFCLESMAAGTLIESVPIEISLAESRFEDNTPRVCLNIT